MCYSSLHNFLKPNGGIVGADYFPLSEINSTHAWSEHPKANVSYIAQTRALRALVFVVLKSYIVIFSTAKYKNLAILVKPKPNNLAPQLQVYNYFWLCTITHR